jgi:hypothetical protein
VTGALVWNLRQAVSVLARRKRFNLAVALILALGIGANTLVLSLVKAAMRPLPYTDSQRLALINFTPPGHPEQR